ncbi:hypothetical protein ACKFKG_20400 [Phormidesmis sp. 146-35]
MAERLLNAGFWLCDFAYALLEAIQLRFLPDSIPRFIPFRVSSLVPLQDLLPDAAISHSDEFEILRVLLIGSSDGVTEAIQNLHVRRFANATDWSPLLPAPSLGEVMSILTRQRQKAGDDR